MPRSEQVIVERDGRCLMGVHRRIALSFAALLLAGIGSARAAPGIQAAKHATGSAPHGLA
jgi:hypothetical protein